MGNQGMTNWKFTAFLTIALMLVAGLFSSTAMAAANDGQGTIALTISAGGDFQAAADPLPQIIFAKQGGYTLAFEYTVGDDAGPLGAINMNGGMVEIAIPTGWTVPHASVTATDGGDTLIATDAEGDDALKRIVLTKSGDNATKVGIKLDADWNVAADASTSLTITMTGVTSATPTSLYVPQTGRPYREYTFRTRSMADKGSLRSLVIGADGTNPQPIARVGNVISGSGQVDVSLVVYEAETARNIELVFTAAGPMYDTDGVDSLITISAPAGLTAPQTTDPAGAGYVTVSRQSGTVLFERPNQKIDTPVGQTITIDIARMEANAKIYVAYRKVDAPAIGAATAAPYTATSTSDATASDTTVTVKPDGNHLRAVAGSGEIKLTRGEVVGAGTKPTLTFTYKAATKLTDAALVIDQPDGGGWTDLVLQSGDSRADNYVSFSGGDSGTALDLDPVTTGNQNVSGSAGQAITLTNVTLNAGASVTVTITRITLTGAAGADPLDPVDNGVYDWPSTLNADTDILADPMLYVVGDARASVAFAIIPTAEEDHVNATATALPHYNAASKENIRFRFTTTTPIKGGYVQFDIPGGWAQPSLTDVKGKATVKLVGWDADASPAAVTLTTPAADADMTLAVTNYQIKVNIVKFSGGAITVQYGTGTGDNRGMVQNRAVDNLEIVGRFKTGSSSGTHPAAAPVSVRVGNVAAGSGTAMITTPASHTVEAGSDDNNITIVYRAAGTMTGGSVRLRSPENWGTLQETDTAGDNHIKVTASSSMVDQAAISYGPRYVLVPLMNVQANNAVSFVFSNVKAQPRVGIAEFTIESAGGPSDSLARLMGEPLPKDADDKNIVDRYMLLGKVYVPRFAVDGTIPERIGAVATADDVTNDTGVIRLEVVAGAGGTGEAKLDRVARSDAGLRNYLNEAGDAIVSERRVHAGDSEIYLVFKYTPVQTITDGALRFTVPTDWTEPQEDSSNTIGYTTVRPSGANVGAPEFENRVVTIPIVDITSSDSIEIHYGSGSFGATAPKTRQVGDAASDFLFAVKGTAGTFSNIGAASVNVYSQASGEGSASAEAENATAGHPEGSITITYDPEGQIVNGRVKLTVDAALTGGADGDGVMSTSGITPSSGTPKYGGDPSMTDDSRTMYGITKNDILVSGVNLGADDMFTFTYSGMMPVAKGDLSFTVAVDGGEGPGETVPPAMPAPMQVDDPVTVAVVDAEAGSGSVMISQMDAEGAIVDVVAGMGGYTIKFTYTAIGEIGEGKKITVTVPDGWSPPLNEAAADEKMGTFTAMHYLKLADDDADGMPNAGDAVTASVATAGDAAEGDDPMIMVATVASGKMVKEGDMVVFTYSNAMAPGMTERSVFMTQYDDVMVEGDDTVVVNSAGGASKVALESANTFMKEAALTVTVKLVDANDEPATRSQLTKVNLSDGGAGGSFAPAAVDISAGEYMGTSTYTNDEVENVIITASTTVTGIAEATQPVFVNTTNPTVDDGSVAFSPAAVKDGGTVEVTATGTPLQTATFTIENTEAGGPHIVTGGGSDMTGDGAGNYTGMTDSLVGVREGTYTVTVHIGDDSESASDALIVDTTAPVISNASRGDDTHVMATDMVTVSAAVSDLSADENVVVSGVFAVSADVSGLNADESPLDLTDADGDGVYEGTVEVTAADPADDGEVTITITASDAAGNEAKAAMVMVTLDNTDPEITGQEIDMKQVMVGGMATISATLSEAADVSADVSMLNAGEPTLTLMDADGDGEGMVYSGIVEVTEKGDAEDIAIEITATDAAGNTGTASVTMVTLDNTDPVISDASRGDDTHVMATDMVTISATLSEAADVEANVSGLNADASPLSLEDADGDGEGMMYTGTVEVTAADPASDGEVTITITASDAAGNEAEAAMVMVTLDNTDPEVTGESIDMSHVRASSEVTISAMVSEAADVSADVSMLNADAPTLTLMDADGSGMYSGTVMVTADGDAADIEIEITAEDAAGNTGTASVMVTLDNTDPEVTGESIDMSSVMAGDEVTISAMVSEAADVSADVSMLNADAPTLTLMDADSSGMYSGTVMVTADGDAADIAIGITATDAAGNMGTASVMVTLDNTVPTVEASADQTHAKNGDTVMLTAIVSEAANVSATVSQLDDTQLVVELTDEDGDLTYTGPVMISMSNTAEDGSKEITVTATDAAGNSGTASASVMLDNTVPEVTDVSGSPSPARNGHPVTISATVSEASTVSADVSDLDTMQTEMVMLTDDDGDGTYTGSFTISDDNEAENGSRTVTVTATDAAGNSGSDTGTVDLINTLDYTSILPAGISLFHVPLDVTAIDGEEATLSMVSDLYNALGDAVNYLITYDGTTWNSYLGGDSGDAPITADSGIVAVMSDTKTITFTGNAWGEDAGPGAGEGASMITLRAGLNLVGVPVNDASISTVSSIMNLPEFAGKVTSIIASTDDGKFVQVTAGGDGDGAVRGDASYLVSASAAASQPVTGEGWSNGEMAGAAPIALFGHTVDNQTPALFVEGSIVDELTGLAKAGFRIKVKNLSTKAALSTVSQSDVSQGYNMTFVDTNAGNAARIGDVLEISADSPDPLIGVKPVRHIVTVDDVKNSRIQLEDLITYEIPAETALLNNYPNPFNPETWIPYHLSEDADVKLTIYDINGEVVRDIDVGHQIAAKYDTRSKAIYWDGRNRFGEQVASGIYFYHLQAGDFSGTRKMVILK